MRLRGDPRSFSPPNLSWAGLKPPTCTLSCFGVFSGYLGTFTQLQPLDLLGAVSVDSLQWTLLFILLYMNKVLVTPHTTFVRYFSFRPNVIANC